MQAQTQKVVVEGRPLSGATPDSKQAAEDANRREALAAFESQENSIQQRMADNNIGFWDDNLANRKFIGALDRTQPHTPWGTPTGQINNLDMPTDPPAGVQVLRADGTFYSIPPGARGWGDIIDPVSKEPLVGQVDPEKSAKRREALLATFDSPLQESHDETPAEVANREGTKSGAKKAAKKVGK
jgi:hypothetical protein